MSWLTRRTRDVGSSLQPFMTTGPAPVGTDGLAGVPGQDAVDRGGLVHAAVGLDVVEPGHRDHVPLGVGIQRRQVVRGDRVVVVDQGDECAAGQRDPGVARTPGPGVVEELHDPPGDPRVRRGVLGDQLAAAIRGAVEDDDHLEQVRVHRLRRQRVQARTQIRHTLKARHHHRDPRHELVLGGRGHGGHYAVGPTCSRADDAARVTYSWESPASSPTARPHSCSRSWTPRRSSRSPATARTCRSSQWIPRRRRQPGSVRSRPPGPCRRRRAGGTSAAR